MSAYGSRSLKKGDTGPDVQEIQVRLALFGSKNHSVSCSDKFDDNFELAVRRFQKIFGLNETGMVDASVFQFIENLAIQNASDADKIFSEYKCKCQTRSAANLEKMVDIWNGHVAGKCKRTDGSLAKKIKTSGSGATFKVVDGLECKGFGSQLTKVALTSANTWSFSGYSDVTENPGMHRILGWALFMFLQLLKKNKENEAISLDIGTSHNGYRCNLDYYHVCRFAKKGAAMTNHTGNAVDLHVKCKKKLTFYFTVKTIPPISTSSTDHCISLIDWLEEFGVVTGDRVKVEGVKPKPFKEGATNTLRTEGFAKTGTWTHIDATTYAYKAYVTNAADLFSPRYTAGSATSPVVPPQDAPKASSNKNGGAGAATASGASSPAYDALLDYAEKSKEWLQNSFSTFFDAYREGQIADAHDAIQADDGFFPVGKNLTWHGGIHAVGQADGSVHAITDGVVVAARIPDKDPAKLSFGSRNFVLVKHQTPAGKPFWSLYMHLRPIPLKVDDPKVAMLFPWLVRQKLKQTGGGGSNFRVSPDGEAGVLRTIGQGETLVSIEAKVVGTQKWIKAKADKDGLVGWLALTSRFEVKSEIDQLAAIQAGKVVNLNLPVKRGDCLGYISPPKPGKKPFLHWEIFSDQVVSNQWLQVKDEDNDIVCDAVKFKELLNKSKAVTFFDSLTESDIVAAYSDPKISAEIRKRAYFFKSEWSVEWKSALEKLKDDFEVEDLAPRLEPYNFWKEAEAAKCDIPKGGKVWHYRPPEFIAREFPTTKAVPVKAESTSAEANEEFDIDWDFIAQMEGTINKVYVPVDKGVVIGKSGPTVASGFDIGQRDAAGLKKFGFSPSLESKLIKYVSLSGSKALDFVNDNPCTLSDDEVREVNHKVKPVYAKSAESFFNSQVPEGGKKFKSYPRGIQTAFVSVYFQYNTAKSLRASIIAGDYAEATNSLLTFTSKTQSVTHKTTKKKSQVMQYLPRRIKEARRLITAITDQDQLAKAKAYIKEKEEQWFDARGENV